MFGRKARHVHTFHYDNKEAYEQAYKEIILSGQRETYITATCRCGETKKYRVYLNFGLDKQVWREILNE